MPAHPRSRTTRRDFLVRSGGGALALAGMPALLTACGDKGSTGTGPASSGPGSTLLGAGGVPLPRRENPVTLPLYDDNPPIADGLSPEEGGTLRLYNWSYYIDPAVTKSFGKEHGVEVEVATFAGMDEAIGKLTAGALEADIFFPALDQLSKLVVGKVVQPLNLSYIPNLAANVWPQFVDPFYDKGARYSVPYTVWTTGIGYRTDRINEDIAAMDNPYEIFWQAEEYRSKVSILPEKRDALALSLLRHGVTDVNTEDPALIERAGNELIELTDLVKVQNSNYLYEEMPADKIWLGQIWSGNLFFAPTYFPEGADTDVISYWYPPDGNGLIGNDMMVILKNSKKPVLAHMFLDHLLDNTVGYQNYVNYNGYQPPLTSIDPARVVSDGLLPSKLAGSVVTEQQHATGHELLPLTTEGEILWQDAWVSYKSDTR